MSIYVADFNPSGSGAEWLVVHDDAPGGAHTGTLDPTSVAYAASLDGTANHQFLMLSCPVCGAASTHPVGGGAQPPRVQELFIHLSKREGCPCPEGSTRSARTTPDSSNQQHHDHVKEHAEAMDGEGRWQVTPEQLAESGIPLS